MGSAQVSTALGLSDLTSNTPGVVARPGWLVRVFSNRPLAHQLRLAFGMVLLVLVIDTASAVRSTAANQQAFTRVARTYAVIDLTQEAFNNLVNMETGYRGFLLSGDDAFLEPYVSGRLAFDEDLTQLKAITQNNPAQMARGQDLEQRAAGW